MTAIDPTRRAVVPSRPATSHAATQAAPHGTNPPRTLHVRWTLSAEAGRALLERLGPDAASPSETPNPSRIDVGPWSIDWTIDSRDGRGFEARARLLVGDSPRATLAHLSDPAASLLVMHDPDLGLIHARLVDASGEEALSVTLRPIDAGAWHVLYARSSLLARLGIAGGRYDLCRDSHEAPAKASAPRR